MITNASKISLFAVRVMAVMSIVAPIGQAQQAAVSTGPVAVPRLVQFSGVAKEAAGKLVAGVTFALYKDQQGGAPLWTETQNVPVDESGRYAVLLGVTRTEGLPQELFTSGEAQWLSVQVEGQPEQPRVLLLNVPYALKAVDAETLGGKPASAFVLNESLRPTSVVTAGGSTVVAPVVASAATELNSASPANTSSLNTPLATACTSTMADGTATANQIAKFTAPCQIHQSQIVDNGTNVGIGTALPASKLDVAGGGTIRGPLTLPPTGTASGTSTAGFNSQPFDLLASAWSTSGTPAAVSEHFRWQAEPAGSNTTTPSGKLNLLFASGMGTPAETGLSISSAGVMTFASGQTLPTVAGNETVTGNLTAKQLVSNVATGTAPLVVGSTTQVANLNASQLGGFTASALAKLSGGNTFSGNQTVTGNVSANRLITTVATGTAPLSVASTTQVANLNASLLGGLGASQFAQLAQSNLFVHNQAIMSGGLAINTANFAPLSILEADVNAPGALGPTLTLVNPGGNLNAAASVDFKTYGEVGSPYNPSSRIEAVDVGNFGNNIVFLLNTPGAPSNGLVEALRVAPDVTFVSGSLQASAGPGNIGLAATGGVSHPGFFGGRGVLATGGDGGAGGGDGVAAIGGNGLTSGTFGGVGIVAFGGKNRDGSLARAGEFHGDVNVSGCIAASGTVIGGSCQSDIRLKENIQPFSPVLDRLVQLQPVSYNWKVEQYPQYQFGASRTSGLIAQEVEKIFPDMVSVDQGGFKRVNYSELPYLMLQAIRDLKTENDNLRQELKAGQERIRRIEEALGIHRE